MKFIFSVYVYVLMSYKVLRNGGSKRPERMYDNSFFYYKNINFVNTAVIVKILIIIYNSLLFFGHYD